jgi:hypothetical protein
VAFIERERERRGRHGEGENGRPSTPLMASVSPLMERERGREREGTVAVSGSRGGEQREPGARLGRGRRGAGAGTRSGRAATRWRAWPGSGGVGGRRKERGRGGPTRQRKEGLGHAATG